MRTRQFALRDPIAYEASHFRACVHQAEVSHAPTSPVAPVTKTGRSRQKLACISHQLSAPTRKVAPTSLLGRPGRRTVQVRLRAPNLAPRGACGNPAFFTASRRNPARKAG